MFRYGIFFISINSKPAKNRKSDSEIIIENVKKRTLKYGQDGIK